MSPEWLNERDLPQWDRFVLEQKDGLVYHTSAWKRAVEGAFPHIEGNFLVLREGPNAPIRAGIPIYTVKSWLLGTRLISIPFATLANPLVSSPNDTAQLLNWLGPAVARSTDANIELRGLRNADALTSAGFRESSAFKHHFIRLDRSFDELSASFSRTAVRRMVAKALKSGVTIQKGASPTDLNQFYELFVQSRRRLELPPIPRAFFESLWKEFAPENLLLLLAMVDGRPVGGVIGINLKEHFFLEYSGEVDGVQKIGVNQLLYWEAVREAIDRRCREFSFGRTSLDNVGLIQYKRHWGTVEEDLSVFTWTREKGELTAPRESSAQYKLVKHLAAMTPMPLFRLLGKFCYSHWG